MPPPLLSFSCLRGSFQLLDEFAAEMFHITKFDPSPLIPSSLEELILPLSKVEIYAVAGALGKGKSPGPKRI